jgi:hypothetical protein
MAMFRVRLVEMKRKPQFLHWTIGAPSELQRQLVNKWPQPTSLAEFENAPVMLPHPGDIFLEPVMKPAPENE